VTQVVEEVEATENSLVVTKPKPELKPDGTPNHAFWQLIGAQLRKPMPTKGRPGRGGRTFDYVTARQVQDRLDAVVGPENWATSYEVIDLGGPAIECTLTLFGISKADVGYSNAPEKDDETEPLKAAYSDAFKRAAVAWGVGRFLYGDS
jgi:hypothetical protein